MNALQQHSFQVSKPQIDRLSVVSLFSGCGGLDLGFRGGFEFLGTQYGEHPFDIVWANDVNRYACETYKANLDHQIVHGDIWDVIDTIPETADVVLGGFPCQDISINGKGRGVDGARSGLYRAMVEVVARTMPKVFIAENVKALLMKHNTSSLNRVVKDFSELGYDVTVDLVNSADYGVPQTRERVFIVGTQRGFSFNFPKLDETWISAEKAIGDLETLDRDEGWSHIWSVAKKSAEQGGRRLKRDRPGYTIRAECHGNIQFHYSLDRRMSMREAARVQSFPDDFHFKAKLRETERMIGNAVPPVLGWYVASAVSKALSKELEFEAV